MPKYDRQGWPSRCRCEEGDTGPGASQGLDVSVEGPRLGRRAPTLLAPSHCQRPAVAAGPMCRVGASVERAVDPREEFSGRLQTCRLGSTGVLPF